MNRLVNYILDSKDNLTLQIKWDKHLGWFIYIMEKGYDMPLISVADNDKDEVFRLAYATLKLKLEGHI